MRALISVYDKSGLEELARGLHDLGWELVSSGGTATAIEALGLPVTSVEEVTEFPEMLHGRVKTLHPRIHAGILARRDDDGDVATLEQHGIAPFDLVCINLYPFESDPSIELIDVGGPSMLRGAAKNHAHVVAVCDAADYTPLLDELRRDGAVSDETRRRLAAKAFATTAAYDAAIASWFAEEPFPQTTTVALDKVLDLSYGENPHQRAAYYAERGARAHLLSHVEQLHGKDLSFNNLNDLSAAVLIARELDDAACVIVKHANPCGAAIASTVEEAYDRALASDPTSAYGGIVVVNRPVDAALGEKLAEQFVEVLLAPAYDDGALEALRRKQGTRILLDGEKEDRVDRRTFKRVAGGMLVQDPDAEIEDGSAWEVACGAPTDAQWRDLVFAWRVCKHVSSNAIVLAKDGATISVGAGQMSRVDAVRIAVEKAAAHGHDVHGAALASDAFFPFADGPQIALDAGATSIVQPGGSKRDQEVADAVAAAGASMVLTGRRHFRH